jgi:glycerophosphoryl diester phosphodiesterase
MTGNTPRPFYVIGHNPNSLENADAVLRSGANALEPDIQVNHQGKLVVAHDPWPAHSSPLRVETYLEALVDWSQKRHPQLALVVFDSKLADRVLGGQLLGFARRWLRPAGIKYVISVGSLSMATFFDDMVHEIGAGEARGPTPTSCSRSAGRQVRYPGE